MSQRWWVAACAAVGVAAVLHLGRPPPAVPSCLLSGLSVGAAGAPQMASCPVRPLQIARPPLYPFRPIPVAAAAAVCQLRLLALRPLLL